MSFPPVSSQYTQKKTQTPDSGLEGSAAVFPTPLPELTRLTAGPLLGHYCASSS